jgi:hypothetical protein
MFVDYKTTTTMNTTTKRVSATEKEFHRTMKRFSDQGHDVRMIVTPASEYFGESVAFDVFGNSAYAAFTLRKSGGLRKRTTVMTFGMINGKKVSLRDAIRRIGTPDKKNE